MSRREINELDLLDKNHFPVSLVFNQAMGCFFISALGGLRDGGGFGVDFGACLFTDDLQEFERTSNHVEHSVVFSLMDGYELYLDYEAFLYYLGIACDRYCEENPHDKKLVDEAFQAIKKRLLG